MRAAQLRPAPSFLPLLARCAFIVSLLCPAVFAVVYPERKAERDDYNHAPPCPSGTSDSGSCRLVIEAVVTGGSCHDALYPSPDDFCEMQLRIGDSIRFIGVDRWRFERDTPGTTLRVEVFRAAPTGIMEGDRFIEARGSPREAIEQLKQTMIIWAVIGALSGGYLYCTRRAKRAAGNR